MLTIRYLVLFYALWKSNSTFFGEKTSLKVNCTQSHFFAKDFGLMPSCFQHVGNTKILTVQKPLLILKYIYMFCKLIYGYLTSSMVNFAASKLNFFVYLEQGWPNLACRALVIIAKEMYSVVFP